MIHKSLYESRLPLLDAACEQDKYLHLWYVLQSWWISQDEFIKAKTPSISVDCWIQKHYRNSQKPPGKLLAIPLHTTSQNKLLTADHYMSEILLQSKMEKSCIYRLWPIPFTFP